MAMPAHSQFAADLKNEPHGAYWGPPPAGLSAAASSLYPAGERWDEAASEIGSVVHASCPRWLIFVEGVGHCRRDATFEGEVCQFPSASGQDVRTPTWWGENLQGAASYPVVIRDAQGRKASNKVCVWSALANPRTCLVHASSLYGN